MYPGLCIRLPIEPFHRLGKSQLHQVVIGLSTAYIAHIDNFRVIGRLAELDLALVTDKPTRTAVAWLAGMLVFPLGTKFSIVLLACAADGVRRLHAASDVAGVGLWSSPFSFLLLNRISCDWYSQERALLFPTSQYTCLSLRGALRITTPLKMAFLSRMSSLPVDITPLPLAFSQSCVRPPSRMSMHRYEADKKLPGRLSSSPRVAHLGGCPDDAKLSVAKVGGLAARSASLASQ